MWGGFPLPGGRQCGVALYACLPYYNNGSTCVRSSRYLLGQGMTAAGREGAWPRPCAVALYAYWPLYNAGGRYLLVQRTCNAAPVARRLGCVTYHLLRSRRRHLRVGMSPALIASTGGGRHDIKAWRLWLVRGWYCALNRSACTISDS